MGLTNWLWQNHQLLMQQCFSLPPALLFYFLAHQGHLSSTYRYQFVSIGGCILAIVMMGVYSTILFTSIFVFTLLVCSVECSHIHTWTFGFQMLWQTFWHLFVQYREHYLHEPVSFRLFLAVSSLMLLTQRITSVSMDLQEKKVTLELNFSSKRKFYLTLLPLISYMISFTTLLGGPLCSYSRFVSQMAKLGFSPPPNPLGVVFRKLMHVLLLESVKNLLVCFLKYNTYDPSSSTTLYGLLWVWVLAVVLRIQYYSHWKISECLNNAAGFGFWENSPGEFQDWSRLSDGDFWTTEASSRMSEFARRWNATTASWLRRLIYEKCKLFPLFMTFGFSLWWHGLHLGHFLGMFTWAATVKADYHIHRCLHPKLSSPWFKTLYTSLSWINMQMIVSCIVIAVDIRSLTGLRLLSTTYIFMFPLFNLILLFILPKTQV